MQMTPCDSSLISAYGYDAERSTLAVTFKNGGTYHYANVPPHVYEDMTSAESVGKFFLRRIKGNADYPFEKV